MTVTAFPRLAPDHRQNRVQRWIPTRAGILNIWRYYDEIFEFHDGRLLLRGPNGSGKSKALELLLPFLFDASLRPNRLSTFGTSDRTMHWNLMGEGASGTTRVGYVWLEFRLPGDAERWFSCGARLQAASHTSTVHPDYFTTEFRIGEPEGLRLVNDAGQPLTRAALAERLGEHGTVHANPGEYRSAVRTTLFPSLSEQRYDTLITALLQLRTPKLSQRLDPSLLSTLLSRALPPLGHQEIADLAEGFERLDAQRERLGKLDEEVDATRSLASRQRTYAQRVLRAHAATLISATSDLERFARVARVSAEMFDQVSEARKAAERRVQELDDELSVGTARLDGLTESEGYKKGQELDRLRQRTSEVEAKADLLLADARRRRAEADSDEEERRRAEQTSTRQQETVRLHAEESRRAASRAGLTSVHVGLANQLETEPVSSRQLVRAAIRARRGQIADVEQAVQMYERSVERRQQAESDLDDARSRYADATDRLDESIEGRATAVTELTTLHARWMDSCRELRFDDPSVVLDRVESEVAVRDAIDVVAQPLLTDIARAEALHQQALEIARTDRDELVAKLDQLRDEVDIVPDPPPTRTADRTGRPGAPLWQLVDFADDVTEETRARLEAALEASGLLDAWIGPRGEIAGHDVFADPLALAPVEGTSLAHILRPERGGEVATSIVERLLGSIAYGSTLPEDRSAAAIGDDGSWRLGNLTGSWDKPRPTFIGTAARQRARERRIQDYETQVGQLDDDIATIEGLLRGLDTRREVIAQDRLSRPGYATLTAAVQRLNAAESDLSAADHIVRQRAETLAMSEQSVAHTLRELTGLAAEHGLPTERAALATLRSAIETFGDKADRWVEEFDRLISLQGLASALAIQAQRSTVNADQRQEEANEAASDHAQLAETLAAVESTIGADYREILAEISTLRSRLKQLAAGRKETAGSVTALAEQLGRLDAQRTTDVAAYDTAAEARDAAARRFRHLANGVFPADGGLPDLARFATTLQASDGVRATRDAARLVAAAWPTVPHAANNLGDALHRLSESVHICRDVLSARADLDLETDEDIQVFTAVVDGIRVGAAELLQILRDEADRSRHEITERERELFDQTLTGDTRRHLAARIRQANELVDGMNARLERVRTASKLAVSLVWQVAPDLPPGTKAARDLLLKNPVQLTEADRESLHRFFRERIEQAKADDTATNWEQQLVQVFDYTAWHQFVVKVDRGKGDGWQLLTRKLHGALSGGEKAIALHLPLFAAVAAHYEAVPSGPRLIMLDEVFVGVDSTNRGQVFALLSALDLDLMLTSDHEWCVYSELSGISIHQLIAGSDEDDAVTTARFTWDGYELLPADSV